MLAAGVIALVAAVAVVAAFASGGDRTTEHPGFATAARTGLETLRVDTDPRAGDAVDGALARHLAAELDFRLRTHCHQMGEPAGPYRYFCEAWYRKFRTEWWVSYAIDPSDGSVRVRRTGKFGHVILD